MIDTDQVMTVREVSLYLKLARSTVYRLAQDGRLPGRKIGGAWRFSRRSLDEWLVRQSPEPEQEYGALPPTTKLTISPTTPKN